MLRISHRWKHLSQMVQITSGIKTYTYSPYVLNTPLHR